MLQNNASFQASSPRARGHLPSIATRIMGVLPAVPLELVSNAIMVSVLRRYPGIQRRLAEHSEKSFVVDPIDCPFMFLLEPRCVKPHLRVMSSVAPTDGHDARIAGAALVLLGLLDGTYDGDALFFSRDLTIEGDTAAVLALRNAIEDAELDPSRILGVPERISPLIGGRLQDMANALRQRLDAPSISPSTNGEPR